MNYMTYVQKVFGGFGFGKDSGVSTANNIFI